ncbi:MAG: nucleotidyltransferase family protein [Actinomycetota bacterium]|nr:nucleotidyltransferase family protein [Actinomycetota bacterium]
MQASPRQSREHISRRRLGNALLGALGGSDRGRLELHEALTRPSGSALVAAAERHGIIGHLREAARHSPFLHPQVAALLDEAYEQAVRTHLRALADLALLGGVLDDAGVPWAVVKGPVLAETVYARFDLRGYRDLDVLVAPRAFSDALRALEEAGSDLFERNWALLLGGMKGQVHLTLPHGSFCDLHWHLLHDRKLRDVYRLPSTALLRRAQPVVLGGVEAASLDPPDAFVHLALHACLSGADRLIWLKDLDEMVRRVPPAWDVVVTRARSAGAGLAVAGVLGLVGRVFRTPLPPGVVEALDPDGVWRGIVGFAARLSPPQRATGDGSTLRLVMRSTRPTLTSSLREAAARSAAWCRHPRSSSLSARMASRLPARGDSALHPSGGAGTRAAYLDAVAAAEDHPAPEQRGGRPAGPWASGVQ